MNRLWRLVPRSWIPARWRPPTESPDGDVTPDEGAVVVVTTPAAVQAVAAPRRDRGPFLLLVAAALVILWLARGVLGPSIIAGVVAYAFSPLVTAAQRRTSWPRVVIVAIGYVIAVAIVAGLVVLLSGRIAREIHLLATSGPDSLARILSQILGGSTVEIGGQSIAVTDIATEIETSITGFFSSPTDAVHLATQAGEAFLQGILALIVTFYFLIDGEMLWGRAMLLLPAEHRDRTAEVVGRIHVVLGRWLRGQLLLIALVTAVVYVALGPILHLPYALGLAVLTGILEIIPLVGPLIATAIAAIDAFAHGGVGLAGVVIVIYFVLRQVEDQVVMPVVIGRVVHLHPVITIFAVLVGLSIYGVLGGLLGVPVAAALNVIFRELYPEAVTPGEPVAA
jgi:predicted PurR-regulated permease PerM